LTRLRLKIQPALIMNDKPPLTDVELSHDLRDFVKWITSYFENPGNLPLSSLEHAAFIKSVFYCAGRLKNSEPFLRAEVEDTLKKMEATRNPEPPKTRTVQHATTVTVNAPSRRSKKS
jgi:hypothetical protein